MKPATGYRVDNVLMDGVSVGASTIYNFPSGLTGSHTIQVVFKLSSASVKTLTSVSVSGSSSVNEDSSANYTATAYFSDGTSQDVTSSAAWTDNSAYAYFDSYAGICSSCRNGKLITQSVTSNQSVTVTASYTYGGATKSGTKTVVITDTASVASAPVAPTNLKATGVSSSSIKVTWTDSSANETGFTVWRWDSQWVKIGTVSANTTSYTDTGLKAGTSYFYQVGAYNSAGTTYAASYVNGTTTASVASAPVAPTNLKATGVSSSSIKVTWTDSSANETGFTVWRWDNSQWVKIGTVSANTTSYTDTGLKAGTTYFYYVAAYNSAGTTYAASYVSGTTSSGGYTKPYILKQGCTFTLYTDYGTSTATSSSSGGWSSSTITSGGIQIVIQNCVITSNPQNVPVYEQ